MLFLTFYSEYFQMLPSLKFSFTFKMLRKYLLETELFHSMIAFQFPDVLARFLLRILKFHSHSNVLRRYLFETAAAPLSDSVSISWCRVVSLFTQNPFQCKLDLSISYFVFGCFSFEKHLHDIFIIYISWHRNIIKMILDIGDRGQQVKLWKKTWIERKKDDMTRQPPKAGG